MSIKTADDRRREACERFRSEWARFESAAVLMDRVHLPEPARSGKLRGARWEARPKRISSFVKKAWKNRHKYADPWTQIDDKVGARLIVANTAELDTLKDMFAADDAMLKRLGAIDDKRDTLEDHELGYVGVHVQVLVPEAFLADGESITCELQLRTRAMDLWSATEHTLAYKPDAELPKQARRRLLRLEALTEIFDEAVTTTMRELENLPNRRVAALIAAAEAAYLTVADEPGSDEISAEVVEALIPALPLDLAEYATELDGFVDDQREFLREVYEDYGAGSAVEADDQYWLFTQPESVIIFERIFTSRLKLAAVIGQSELRHPVSKLYEAAGHAYPEDE